MNGDEIGARCLKLCREVLWNGSDLQAPYSLRGAFLRLRPGSEFPAVVRHPLYVYVEYYGSAGEYDVWVDLVRLVVDNDGDVIDESEEASYGPYSLELLPDLFVQGRSYVLRMLPLSEPGVYELRLRVGGVDHHLISERFIVEE